MELIELTRFQNAIVDDEDYDFLVEMGEWFAQYVAGVDGYYAARTEQSGTYRYSILMHRVVMERKLGEGLPEGFLVDHINHDKLDNRRSNLRLVTRSQSQMNRRRQSNNKSGVTGVNWEIRDKKWHSRIKVAGKTVHLGYFDDFNQAVAARKKAEEEYFGEFAYGAGAGFRF